MAVCQITIVGNLGSDPEMRYTPSGRPITNLSVAVNQGTKDKQSGEWTDATDWFRVAVWGDRAEWAAESLRKGNKVIVIGRFKTREFEGRDGQKRTSLEVNADVCQSLERREREDDAGFAGRPQSGPPAGVGTQRAAAAASGFGSDDLDDLPF